MTWLSDFAYLSLLVFLFLQHPVSEELGRPKRFFYMLIWTVIHSYPSEYHDALGDGTELAKDRRRPVSFLDLGGRNQGFIDRIQKRDMFGPI